jgi:hypothetical protein
MKSRDTCGMWYSPWRESHVQLQGVKCESDEVNKTMYGTFLRSPSGSMLLGDKNKEGEGILYLMNVNILERCDVLSLYPASFFHSLFLVSQDTALHFIDFAVIGFLASSHLELTALCDDLCGQGKG